MNRAPKVSVIVPSFNVPAEIIEESLTSVANQTFVDFECIVIDESTQSELAQACERICARDSRFCYVHPPHRLGLSGSLNLGISIARGELIARFDSDDICFPDRLAVQVAFMDNHSEVGVVGAGLEIINEHGFTTGIRLYPRSFADISRKLHFTTPLAHPTIVFRSSIVKSYGAYNPSFKFSEDLELWLRWLNNGVVFANISAVLVKYRQAQTLRIQSHWRFNLRARLCNFATKFLFLRLAGIVCVGTWSIIPPFFQGILYRFYLSLNLRL